MLTPLNSQAFFVRFPAANELGTGFGAWRDESDRLHTYYTNEAGDVAEVIYEPRTTRYTYNLVTGEPAERIKRENGK